MTSLLFIKENRTFSFLVAFKSFSPAEVSLQFMKEYSLSVDESLKRQKGKQTLSYGKQSPGRSWLVELEQIEEVIMDLVSPITQEPQKKEEGVL